MASTTASTSNIISNMNFGADANGVDVKMFGDTASAYALWDASANNLVFAGAAGMNFGTLSSSAQTGITLTSTNNTVFDVFADDNNTTLGNAVYSNVRARTMLFKDATGITLVSLKGQIKCADEVDFASGVYACVQGYFETMDDTDIQSGAKVWGVDASLESPSGGTVTVDSGGILGGLHAELTGAGEFVNNGTLAGLYIDEQVTTGTWGHGIYIAASAATTGIAINTTSGTALNFPSGETYGKAMAVGAFGTPIVYTTDELLEIHGRVGSATEAKPLMRVRNSGYADGNMTTGSVTGFQCQAYGTSTRNIGPVEAIQAHVGIKGTSTLIANTTAEHPNMRAGWFKIEDLGFDLTLTGSAAVLLLGMQWNTGTTLTGMCDWINLNKRGSLTDPADAFVRVYDGAGGGWATNLFDVPASAPATVASATYSTAEGYFTVKVGGSTYRMPFYTGAD